MEESYPAHEIVVIGASAGGVEVLSELVAGLPGNLPAAVFVCLHVAASAESFLPRILSRAGAIPAVHASHGAPITSGTIYVAPPDHHVVIEPGVVTLSRGPRENRCRPSVDVLFRSAAIAYGPRVNGVVLSGYLDDGAAGLLAIERCGGLVVIQDPEDSRSGGMPRAALEVVEPDAIVTTATVGGVLAELVRRPATMTGPRPGVAQTRLEVDSSQDSPAAAREAIQVGQASGISCPECGGSLFGLKDGPLTRFRCHVGHAYSPASLLEAQSEETEKALWAALRALEERSALLLDMSRQMAVRGSPTATQYADRSAEFHQHAVLLRALLGEAGERRQA
ncbi:MAG TPA: chemotaxis protein CheB [Kofleriaceae bacterium]|nr:chemotaxis protein CheB [Kofleriaceae bacterium]